MTKKLTLILIGISIVLPIFIKNNYILHIFIIAFIYAIAAQAWNLLAGYAGQVSFGHSAYFGIGAYTLALCANNLNIPPIAGIFLGALAATILGLLIFYPSFKLRGAIFSLTTFAFAEILRVAFTTLRSFSGGMAGITIPFRRSSLAWLQFTGKLWPYYICLLFLIVTALVVYKIENSVLGLKLKSIRENQEAAESIGINVHQTKIKVGIISAFFTGIAGGLYVSYVHVIDPLIAFGSYQSVNMIVYTVVGGMGSLLGPILGTIILSPTTMFLNSFLSGFGINGIHLIFTGVLLIIVVLWKPQGLISLLKISNAKNKLKTMNKAKKGI